MYRARYLALVVVGESHPEVALIDSNIGLILHAVGEYEPSLKFLEKALELNIRFHGSKSLKVAVSYHLVARTQSCMGDFRSALQNERETFAIYKSQLGDEHDKTKVRFLLLIIKGPEAQNGMRKKSGCFNQIMKLESYK